MFKRAFIPILAFLFVIPAVTFGCARPSEKPREDIEFSTPVPTAGGSGIDYGALEIDPSADGKGGRSEIIDGTGFSSVNGGSLAYSGGEMFVELESVSELIPWEYGLLIALDGVFQRTRLEADGAFFGAGCMHRVRFAPKVPRTLRFTFTPTVGKAGDTLNLSILMMDNPSAKSDFNGSTTAVYGFASGLMTAYAIMDVCIPVRMSADAPEQEAAAEPELEILPVPVGYSSALEERVNAALPEYREQERKTYTKMSLYSDPPGTVPEPFDREQYVLAGNGDALSAVFEVFGQVEEYRVSVFIDHELAEFSGGTYFDIASSFDDLKKARLDIPLGGRTENGFIYVLVFEKNGAPYAPENSYALISYRPSVKYLFIGDIPEPDISPEPAQTEVPSQAPDTVPTESGRVLKFEKSLYMPIYTAITDAGMLLAVDKSISDDAEETTAYLIDHEADAVLASFELPEHTALTCLAGDELIAVQNLAYDHAGVHIFDLDGNELRSLELTGELGLGEIAFNALSMHYGSSLFGSVLGGNLIISSDGKCMLYAECSSDVYGVVSIGKPQSYDLSSCKKLEDQPFEGVDFSEVYPIAFTGEKLAVSVSNDKFTVITMLGYDGAKIAEWRYENTAEIRRNIADVADGRLVVCEKAQSFPEKGFTGKLSFIDIENLTETELQTNIESESKWARLSADGSFVLTLTGSEQEASFALYRIDGGEMPVEFSLENVYMPWWSDIALIDAAHGRVFIQHYPITENGKQKKAITVIEF